MRNNKNKYEIIQLCRFIEHKNFYLICRLKTLTLSSASLFILILAFELLASVILVSVTFVSVVPIHIFYNL